MLTGRKALCFPGCGSGVMFYISEEWRGICEDLAEKHKCAVLAECF